MPSVTLFNRQFTPSWGMSFLALFFILLFLRLGFWQISRAEEKQSMLNEKARMEAQSVYHYRADGDMPLQYQKVRLEGKYIGHLFFLDNQHHEHQFGYHVLSPMSLSSDPDKVVLIDRGWIKGDISRRKLPVVSTPSGEQEIKGASYYPRLSSFALGPMIEQRGKGKTIIEDINVKKLSQILQKKISPFIIRLDKNEAQGFVREWQVVSMPPERHYAYAVQWFAMASVILIIFIALHLKKNV